MSTESNVKTKKSVKYLELTVHSMPSLLCEYIHTCICADTQLSDVAIGGGQRLPLNVLTNTLLAVLRIQGVIHNAWAILIGKQMAKV
jgi:hypothetical protein